MNLDEFTYSDYLDLEAAWMRKDKRTMRAMIGTEDAITVLSILQDRFEGSGRDDV